MSTRLTTATFALTLASTLVFAGISYFEHRRSLRPSTLLVLFFSITLLCDAAHVRTTFLLPDSNIEADLGLTSLLVKLILLILELIGKDRLVQSEFQDGSPEATASIANRALFAWINRLLWRGSRKRLAIEDLLPLDAELRNAAEPHRLIEKWSKGMLPPRINSWHSQGDHTNMGYLHSGSWSQRLAAAAVPIRVQMDHSIGGDTPTLPNWLYLRPAFHCTTSSSIHVRSRRLLLPKCWLRINRRIRSCIHWHRGMCLDVSFENTEPSTDTSRRHPHCMNMLRTD